MFLIFKICLFDFLNEISVFETCPSISHDFLISKISLFEFLNECLIFKMSPFDFPNGTFDFQNEAIGISARDRQP